MLACTVCAWASTNVRLNVWQTNGGLTNIEVWLNFFFMPNSVLLVCHTPIPRLPLSFRPEIKYLAYYACKWNDIQYMPFICFIIKLIGSLIDVRIEFFDHDSKRKYLLTPSIICLFSDGPAHPNSLLFIRYWMAAAAVISVVCNFFFLYWKVELGLIVHETESESERGIFA